MVSAALLAVTPPPSNEEKRRKRRATTLRRVESTDILLYSHGQYGSCSVPPGLQELGDLIVCQRRIPEGSRIEPRFVAKTRRELRRLGEITRG